MRGRHPSGPEYVATLDGSSQAKERLQIILETMRGAYGVPEACRRLEISEQRFYQLRSELLQAALQRLEPKPAGRPAVEADQTDEVRALQARLVELETELRASQLREEIAVAMPHVVKKEPEPMAESQKKTAHRPKRQARPGWWKKSNK
jgi:hypothetical protein